MTGALIILAVTLVTGLILYLTHKPEEPVEGDVQSSSSAGTADGVCCGLHAVCEKGLSPTSEPVYFDDEELDRFAGRDPENYSAEEVDEFREVLYTLIPADVYPWGVSLTQRNVAMPVSLRDEWIMLAGDSEKGSDTGVGDKKSQI